MNDKKEERRRQIQGLGRVRGSTEYGTPPYAELEQCEESDGEGGTHEFQKCPCCGARFDKESPEETRLKNQLEEAQDRIADLEQDLWPG